MQNLITFDPNNPNEGKFDFFLPLEVISKADVPDGKRWIQGFASDSDTDLQGEKVIQSGINWDFFLSSGYFNDNHAQDIDARIGEPTECRLVNGKLFVKGFLYKGLERADKWWNFIQTIEKESSTRKVGFSIEGKVLLRQGKSILKCFLTNIAITANPVNQRTYLEICKALAQLPNCKHPWKSDNIACKGCAGNCERNPQKDDSMLKDLNTVSGMSMIPESLDSKNKLSKSDAIQELMKKGFSKTSARLVADCVFLNVK